MKNLTSHHEVFPILLCNFFTNESGTSAQVSPVSSFLLLALLAAAAAPAELGVGAVRAAQDI